MPVPAAIETVWNGVRYRSRLEARWAIFFDALGVEHQYEPEGFDLGGLWYLPDFWLPEQKLWLECKPVPATGDDERKINAFARCIVHDQHEPDMLSQEDCSLPWGGKRFVQLVGPPETGHDYLQYDAHFLEFPGWDNHYRWQACPVCGRVGIEFGDNGDRVCAVFRWHEQVRRTHHGPRALISIEEAAQRSRSERFIR